MLVSARSDIGLVRPVNEDNYAVVAPQLFVVADGMGGHVAGEIASKLAVDCMVATLSEGKDSCEPRQLLERGIQEANHAVYFEAQKDSRYAGMGTTLTAVLLQEDRIHWGHVGDSRLYLFREHQLCQLTNDHSLVWELVRAGTLLPEETRSHPQRNILTRAVGASETIQIDFDTIQWQQGDTLLICTDGLTNMLDDQQICRILSSDAPIDSCVHRLINEAKEAGGYDNITVILLKNEGDFL